MLAVMNVVFTSKKAKMFSVFSVFLYTFANKLNMYKNTFFFTCCL